MNLDLRVTRLKLLRILLRVVLKTLDLLENLSWFEPRRGHFSPFYALRFAESQGVLFLCLAVLWSSWACVRRNLRQNFLAFWK